FMAAVRRALAADLVERARQAGAYDRITLCSDDPALLREAALLNCSTVDTRSGFSLPGLLTAVVEEQGLDAVVCMGGGACPLASAADLALWADLVRRQDQVVVVNNPMSPDVIAFHPARAIAR